MFFFYQAKHLQLSVYAFEVLAAVQRKYYYFCAEMILNYSQVSDTANVLTVCLFEDFLKKKKQLLQLLPPPTVVFVRVSFSHGCYDFTLTKIQPVNFKT